MSLIFESIFFMKHYFNLYHTNLNVTFLKIPVHYLKVAKSATTIIRDLGLWDEILIRNQATPLSIVL